jgi:hypothetical protein
MQLLEMFDNDLPGYRTEKDDSTPLKLSDLRKTKLTLKQLNRLRIMNDVRKLEQEKKIEAVQTQFTPPPEPNAGM